MEDSCLNDNHNTFYDGDNTDDKDDTMMMMMAVMMIMKIRTTTP